MRQQHRKKQVAIGGDGGGKEDHQDAQGGFDLRVRHQRQIQQILYLPASEVLPDLIVFASHFLTARLARENDVEQAQSAEATGDGLVDFDVGRMDIDHHAMDVGFFERRSGAPAAH